MSIIAESSVSKRAYDLYSNHLLVSSFNPSNQSEQPQPTKSRVIQNISFDGSTANDAAIYESVFGKGGLISSIAFGCPKYSRKEPMEQIKNEECKGILLGFFQACWVKKHHDDSKESKAKALQTFNEIFKKCDSSSNPQRYLREEMYRALIKSWNPCWDNYQYERDGFMDQTTYDQFLQAYQYAKEKLVTALDPRLDKETANQLAEHLGLFGLARTHPAPSDEGIVQDIADQRFYKDPQRSLQAIDAFIQKLKTSPKLQEKVPQIVDVLTLITTQCSIALSQCEGGPLKQELLSTILDNLFWGHLETSEFEQVCESKLQELYSLASDMDFITEAIDAGAGRMICAHFCRQCNPQEIGSSLFDQVRSTLRPDVPDIEVIQSLSKTLSLSEEQKEEISTSYFEFLEKYTKNEAQGNISAAILFFAAQNYLANNIVDIVLAKVAQRDLSSFYSYELEEIAKYVHRQIQDTLNSVPSNEKGSAPNSMTVPEFVETYLQFIVAQIDHFNHKCASNDHLKLSYFERYQLATTEINHHLTKMGLIQDPIPFPPSCPTSDGKILKLLEEGLKNYQAALPREGKQEEHQLSQENLIDGLNRILRQSQEDSRLQGTLQHLFDKQLSEKQWMQTSQSKTEVKSLLEAFEKDPVEAKHPSVHLDEKTKNQLFKVDLTLGITLAEAKQSSTKTSTQKENANYQEVEQVIEGITEGYNESAFAMLIELMKQDKEIKLIIVQKFQESWNTDRSLFGEDMKKEGALLTEERRNKILDEARYLSKQTELTAAMEEFKRRLNKDLGEGKVIPQQALVKKRYAGFFNLVSKKLKDLTDREQKTWKQNYNRIVSDALLMQEMKKLEMHSNQMGGSFVENELLNLRRLGNSDDTSVRQERHNAEVRVLKTLLEGQGLVGKEMESVKLKIEAAKQESRLQVSNVPKDQIQLYKDIILAVGCLYDLLLSEAKPMKEEFQSLPSTFPKQMRELLLERKGRLIDNTITGKIQEVLKAVAQEPLFLALKNYTTKQIIEYFGKEFQSFHDFIKMDIGKAAETSLQSEIDFHAKWQHRLKGEMIQGLADKHEALGEGVCHGVSSRWAANEQRHPDASVQDLSDPRKMKISTTDRVLQGFYTAAFRLKTMLAKTKSEMNQAFIEKSFPEAFRKNLGINKVDMIGEVEGIYDTAQKKRKKLTPDQLKQFRKLLQDQTGKLKKSHGVVSIRLEFETGAHAIYLRYDPSHKQLAIFRLGEPNIGLLELMDEKEFFDCFEDLCQVYYKEAKVSKILAFQFIL